MSLDINPIWNEGGPSGLGWSEIAPFFRCPKEYEFAKVKGIGLPQKSTPDYFFVGSAFHAGRAMWLTRKCAMESETDAAIAAEVTRVRKEYEDKLMPVSEQAVKDVTRYLTEYRDHYSMSPAPKTVAVEHLLGPTPITYTGNRPLPEGHDYSFLFRTARLDDVSYYHENGGTLCIGECKTGSGTPAQTINEYQLHGQPLLQWILWHESPQGAAQYGALSGIVLDVIQKGYGGKKCQFVRAVITPEPHAVKWFRAQLNTALYAIDELRESGEHWHRNITSCAKPRLGPGGAQMGACPYRNLCTYGEAAAGDYTYADGSPLKMGDWE